MYFRIHTGEDAAELVQKDDMFPFALKYYYHRLPAPALTDGIPVGLGGVVSQLAPELCRKSCQ